MRLESGLRCDRVKVQTAPQGVRLLDSDPLPGPLWRSHCSFSLWARLDCSCEHYREARSRALSPGVHACRGCGHRAAFGSESTLRDQCSQSRLWAAWKGLLSTDVLRKEGVQLKEVVLS